MIRGRCVDKVKDRNGVTTGYVIQTYDNEIVSVTKDYMKYMLRHRDAYVENLKLTSDNKIISIESDSNVQRILKSLSKARLLGLKITTIATYCGDIYVVSNNKYHIMYIPDYIHDTGNSFNYFGAFISNLEGRLKVIGGRNIKNMNQMFRFLCVDELDLSEFSTESAYSTMMMFADTYVNKLDLTSFDTSKVEDMDAMFKNSEADIIDISSFNTEKVTSMSSMFMGVHADIDISKLNTKRVTYMGHMFHRCSSPKLDFRSFDTSRVESMRHMFDKCKTTHINISNFNIRKDADLIGMFKNCHSMFIDIPKSLSDYTEIMCCYPDIGPYMVRVEDS